MAHGEQTDFVVFVGLILIVIGLVGWIPCLRADNDQHNHIDQRDRSEINSGRDTGGLAAVPIAQMPTAPLAPRPPVSSLR